MTHEVTNQPPPLVDYDVFSSDLTLNEAVRREGAGAWQDELVELGRLAGSATAMVWGQQANANPPVLHTHDRYGHRIDTVDYHPAYHELMRTAVAHGIHAAPWADPAPGTHVARAAKMIVWSQVDAGHICPVSMTYSALPALAHDPELAAAWKPGLTSRVYDTRRLPYASKDGLVVGMAMTEKQGGSDVRANTTQAEPAGPEGEYLLTGHKWFCSAPMSDGFLVLAQAPGGLTCFLLPRVLPDGTPNVFRLQRLKDKLGDRSNASSEVEFERSWARRVGEEGRGVRTIIEMVQHTRLDCALGTAGIMRSCVAQATHHARHREAFGRRLVDHPLMRNVLADLAVESEAATVTVMRLARAFDPNLGSDTERAFARIATPVVKFWVCKRAPAHAAEALECLGGNGYVEESGMPRLLRQSPLNGIWEGSGNVICLDVLRALARTPESAQAFLDEVSIGTGADTRLDDAVASLRKEFANVDAIETRARRVVSLMAVTLQASLLIRFSPPAVADAFCASRLDSGGWHCFGALPSGAGAGAVIERHTPQV
jgi:putative acyl-CoA dehydrogenase